MRKLRLPGVQGDRDGRVDGLADLEHAAVVEDGVTEVGQLSQRTTSNDLAATLHARRT